MSGSREPGLLAALIVTYIFAIVAVCLRFWARDLKRAGLWIDDYLMLAAIAATTALGIDFLIWIHHGLGNHYRNYDHVFYYFHLCLFVAQITHTTVICTVKFSILSLYWRIFGRERMQVSVYVTAFFVTCWGLGVIITGCLQCIPTRGIWDKSIHAVCGVNNRNFLLEISVPNIVTDVAILILPMPHIHKLHTTKNQKVLLAGNFLLGGFVMVAYIVRFAYVISFNGTAADTTYDFSDVAVWTIVQANLAIVSANLPCLRPVWARVKDGVLSQYSPSYPSSDLRRGFGSRSLSDNKFLGPRGQHQRSSSISRALATEIESTRNLPREGGFDASPGPYCTAAYSMDETRRIKSAEALTGNEPRQSLSTLKQNVDISVQDLELIEKRHG